MVGTLAAAQVGDLGSGLGPEGPIGGSASRGGPGGLAAGRRGPMLLVLRLQEALSLSDEETVKIARVFRQAGEKRGQLFSRRAQIEQKIESELKGGSPSAGELQRLFDEGIEVDRALGQLPADTFRDAGKELSVEKRARLVLLKRQMKDQVRAERERRGRRGGMGMGDQPGGGLSGGMGGRRRGGLGRFRDGATDGE